MSRKAVISLDFQIDERDIEASSKKLMETLRPQWNLDDIKVKVFTDGITNKLVGCYVHGAEDMILVRIYGEKTDLIIDRVKEKQNVQIMHRAGLAPPLHCAFHNGICYGYVDGVTLDEVTVRQPHMQRLIAKKLVAMHSLPRESINAVRGENNHGKVESCYPQRVKRYLSMIPTHFDDPIRQHQLQTQVPSKKSLEVELDLLLQHLDQIHCPVVFSHNDLLCKNIIYSQTKDDVTFIDYEYADYSWQLYDIGNHFCEYAGVEVVDYANYPDKATQTSFLRHYLEFWNETQSPGKLVTDSDLERLYCHANKYALAAHFMWGVWALIQASNSSIDFDFLSYSVLRLNEYYTRRDQFLALPLHNA